MNCMKDYYQILGILETASLEDIRQAYLRMALDWHPDRHTGESPERIAIVTACFQEIGEAYGVLSDPSRKADYDWVRHQIKAPLTPWPARPSSSTSAAGRPPAGRPSSTGRQPYQTSGSRKGMDGRTDSSYSRTRNWGVSYSESHSMDAATGELSFGIRVSEFIFDVLQAVWEILYACVTVISCAIKIYSHRMRRRHKQTYTV